MTKLLLKLLELLQEDKTVFKSGTKAPFSGVFRSGREYIPLTKNEKMPPSFTGG